MTTPARMAFVVVLACALVPRGTAQLPGFVSTRGESILGGDGRPLLLRGINLGNWLVPEGYMFKFKSATSPRMIHEVIAQLAGPDEAQSFWKEYRDRYITRNDIRFIARRGFNSVRVPFNFRLLTPEDHPGLWCEDGFALLDSVIGWCREEGLLVVLDMHCAPGGQTGDNIDDSWGYPWLMEDSRAQRRTAEVWKTLAARYSGETTILGYDLLNEPIPPFFDTTALNPRLEPLYRMIVRNIRDVDTNHVVILGGAQWDGNLRVFGPPFDARVVYTFHRYWTDTAKSVIGDILEFRERVRVPVWMGESGENNDAWIGGFRRMLERESIGWAFWPYKKMDATSSPVTFPRPPFWEDIVAFADGPRTTFAQVRERRPPPDRVRAALRGFLDSCRFDRCRVNEGYLRALGLKQDH
jgi:hypothetical protein